MFRTKLLLILPLVVAVTLGQANRSEEGQWLFLSPGRPMLVAGHVNAAPEAPVPISIPAFQPGKPAVVVPLPDEPVPTGEQALVTEQPPASVQNVYNIIYLQYEPVVQPKPVTQCPPPTPKALPPFPPMTSYPTGSHPTQSPSPPRTVATQAPSVVVTTESHPAVTQAPGQLMFDFQCKEEDGYYSVEHECNTYIECKQNRAMKYTCPGGLHFNPAAKYNENPCAYPSEVKCMPCDQEQSPEPTAVCARIEPVVQPEPVTQYPPPTPKALPPFPPMTSYPTGSHPTQTPSPPRTVATQAPPVVVPTESHPALTQAPKQLMFDGQSKETNGYYPVEAPIAPAPIFIGPSTPAAPHALAAPSYTTVLHPRPRYTPVHRRILSPRPIRLAPTAVVPPQLSAIGEPQPPVQGAAPLVAPVVVTTQSHPAVTQAPGQLMLDFQCKEENGYYSVEHECNTYIECKQNRAMKYTCPGGLHFNPAAKYNENPCAYPSEVNCMPCDQEQSPEPTAICARIEPVVQPEPVTQYPPPTPKALPPFPTMTSYPTGSHPTQTPSPPRTVATQAPPVVVTTESHLALTQAPKQLVFNGQSKEANGNYPVEAPIAPAPILVAPSTPAAPPALAAPSYATVLHPRPLYTPVHRRILSPRPIRLAPTAVVPSQLSAIGEPQPPVQEAAPLAAPVVVTTQSHPAVTQAPGQLMFDFQCKEENRYYSVEHECNTYIECKQNRAMKYTCPGGLHFNPAAKYNENPCAYPSEVNCMPESPKPIAECPVQNAFYSMSDGDCSQYIRCHEGVATIMKCPEGLAFNPQINVCDWAANVTQCNLNVGEMK